MGIGGVDPNGHIHRPLLNPSLRWWVYTAVSVRSAIRIDCFPHILPNKIIANTTESNKVVQWKGGLCRRDNASFNLKDLAMMKWSTSIKLDRHPQANSSLYSV